MDNSTKRTLIVFTLICCIFLGLVLILFWPKPPAYYIEVQNWAKNANGTVTNVTITIPIRSYSEIQKQEFKKLQQNGQATWYVDEVIPDQSFPYHFHFQGVTMITTDQINIGLQTTIANISTNPNYYAAGGVGGYPQWAINITVLDVF